MKADQLSPLKQIWNVFVYAQRKKCNFLKCYNDPKDRDILYILHFNLKKKNKRA